MSADKENFEAWLKSLGVNIYTYLIFCGKVNALDDIYLVLNKEKYTFDDPVKAVEACYKCLSSLHAFPTTCDLAWLFIDKAIYNFTFKKK